MKDLVLRDQVHHGLMSTERSQRQSASDGFGKADEIRRHTKICRGTTPAELGAGLDFVEDQERTFPSRDFAQAFEEARLRETKPHVHQDGFQNDGGDLSWIFFEAPF